ncbi:MAG: DUF3370 domain-containing protein [Timaviella obliquedivisa GSE-PSE-MK23-08B]|jgi:hypothetical protein|nr:DUF3370 domain-containing protein [Timaviella obliquedivisa GSE-PSE-MK23-08B]
MFILPFLVQVPPSPVPQAAPPPATEIVQPQEVRALPGQLDRIPVFNSNSPELVQTEGILLSTFPPRGKQQPAAHLNFPFNGVFDLFAHHVFKAIDPDFSSLYLGIIVYNPGDRPVTLSLLQAASYLSQPDAPFIPLAAQIDNSQGDVYAGPGSRAMSDVLRGRRQDIFPAKLTIAPQSYQMLMNFPIPVASLDPPLNGRSTLLRLQSDGQVHLASLALLARKNADGSDRSPTLEEWQSLLENGGLSSGRDRVPTPLDQAATRPIIYGRVAGVAQGARWQAQVTDSPTATRLTIPAAGKAFSYGLSTLMGGRLGTEQVQSAPMLVRYPDTAYQAHGNYGIEYNLALPLHNSTQQAQTVTVALQTPIKEDELSTDGLRFFDPLPTSTFFRGTVRVSYRDDQGLPRTRYVHLVQRRGQPGEALVTLKMAGGDRRLVQFRLMYPPDATPPQVLTVRTLAE